MNNEVLDVLTLNLSVVLTFRFLTQIKSNLTLKSIIQLYFNILPAGVRINVNETRGRRVEGIYAGKTGITELIPIFSNIRCNHCTLEFKTIYSFKRHEFSKHIRSFKCATYITQDGENKESGEMFQGRKSYNQHGLSVHNKFY